MVTNGFGNQSFCSQLEGSACTDEGSSCFLLGGGGEERDFLFFPGSQCGSILGSPQVPQDVPNSTSDLSHMTCPKV
jgi:hypothetical protein